MAVGGVHRVIPSAAQPHLGCLIVYEILDFIVTGGTPLGLGGHWLLLLLFGAGSRAGWGPGSLIDPGHGQCTSRALTLQGRGTFINISKTFIAKTYRNNTMPLMI